MLFIAKAAVMQLVESDKNDKEPPVWATYQKLLDSAENRTVIYFYCILDCPYQSVTFYCTRLLLLQYARQFRTYLFCRLKSNAWKDSSFTNEPREHSPLFIPGT